MKDIIIAVGSCCENDVIHRDIKPENLMFLNKDNTGV